MKGRIFLSKDDFLELRYNVSFDYDYDYCVSISTDLSDNFDDLMNDNGEMLESIISMLQFSELCVDIDGYANVEFFTECLEKKDELLPNASYIEFNFSIDEIIQYIKKNPILKTKKIILSERLGFDTLTLNKIYNELSGEVDNLYFQLYDNYELISFNDCKQTYEKLEMFANQIKKFDFSPLETIMYVYDLVRNKVYVKEDKDENQSLSRDLTAVLFGDKIVCLGYARILDALLSMLGIDTRIVYLYNKEKNTGHARNEIYVKDDKYGVDGVYYFDATWDSKKNDFNNNYLLSYKCFAKTKHQMDILDDGKIVDSRFPYFSSTIALEFEEIMEQVGLDGISKEMLKSINYMSTLIKGKYLIDSIYTVKNSSFYGNFDFDAVISELFDIVEYFNSPLSADTLLKVLYNVRKVQYYIEPEKFPFGIEQFYKTVLLSDWSFEGSTPHEKLLFSIFAETTRINDINHMQEYDNNEQLSKRIGQVKLTRTLKKICDKKNEENL